MSDNELPLAAPDLDSKASWRRTVLDTRDTVAPDAAAAEAEALAAAALGLLRDTPTDTVCCYLPFGTEPGFGSLLDDLRTGGWHVLLPVVPAVPGPLDWSVYEGPSSVRSGAIRGVLEPSGPRQGPDAITRAGVVLVPALAVDRAGVRLGRGAGYYDRSLPLVRPGTELVGVVRDSELVCALPADEHDVRLTAAATPGRGVVPLPLL